MFLNVKLKHCYGILSLEHKFDFQHSNTYAIYAPNGSMKTSFAKTILDFSNGITSKNEIFVNRVSERVITDENDVDLVGTEFFVIESLNDRFSSDLQSTLLADKALKDEYDEIHLEINNSKNTLLKQLRTLSRVKSVEEEIVGSFKGKTFFEIIELIEMEVFKNEAKFKGVIYKELFNPKTIAFLNEKDFSKRLVDYMNKFNKLIGKSKYFKNNFDHYKVLNVQKTLKESGFFKADHLVALFDGKGRQDVTSEDDLEALIQKEMEIINNDESLAKQWSEIDNELNSKNELREFREYLKNNKHLVVELGDVERFKRELWVSYIVEQSGVYIDLLNKYRQGKARLEEIVVQAKDQETDWVTVVDIFNQRFFVPFKLKVINQEDVILKNTALSIGFTFSDQIEEVNIRQEVLLKSLSQGEKRALYILNIIFEIEARKKIGKKTIFIIDDIADSFDYKNKYAIIEYLKDISNISGFYQIILTHNFDFFRTLESRFVKRQNCLVNFKKNDGHCLEEARGIRNPFVKLWKGRNLNQNKNLVSAISFVRNIIEYTKGEKDKDYLKLTSLLHWKVDTETISVYDFQGIYNSTFATDTVELENKDRKIVDLIFDEANKCLKENPCNLIENKIILSIAIRLSAEKFMVKEINNVQFWESLNTKTNQTNKLFDEYARLYSDPRSLKILEQVNLITPENIHLNSFMFEPILDMSDEHLKQLYKAILDLPKHNS